MPLFIHSWWGWDRWNHVFPSALARSKTQKAEYMIRTQVTKSISYENNCYTKRANTATISIFTRISQIFCNIFVGANLRHSNTPRDANCTATCLPSRKLYRLDEPDTPDTAGEAKDELVSDVLLWTPTYGQVKAGRPARTYIQQLCEDTGCNPEDLLEAMIDREKWREMVEDIRAGGTTRWWRWWIILRIYINR